MEYYLNRAFLNTDNTHPSKIREKFISLTDILDSCATLIKREYKNSGGKIKSIRTYDFMGQEIMLYHEETFSNKFGKLDRRSRLLTLEINPTQKDGGALYDKACQDLKNLDILSSPRPITQIEELFL